MSQRAFPLLFLNLGGEMTYILDQRLHAQQIPDHKARKVLNDIVSTMLNKRFTDELFKPQQLYTKRAVRSVFAKLAHISIMRLNSASMDKLYDLMTMAVKYQVYKCAQATDLLLVTLNHLDSMRDFVTDAAIHDQVFEVYVMLIKTYSSLSPGDFELVRQTLMAFFQDIHVRVSIFLRDKIQTPNGRFTMPIQLTLPFHFEIPGKITCFDTEGKRISIKEFDSGGSYVCHSKNGSHEYMGDRVITLGRNIYISSKAIESITDPITPTAPPLAPPLTPRVKSSVDELNFLADLLGSMTEDKGHEFKLNLFNTTSSSDDESSSALDSPPKKIGKILHIDASSTRNESLAKIMGEMTLADMEDIQNDDILDLMDYAATK